MQLQLPFLATLFISTTLAAQRNVELRQATATYNVDSPFSANAAQLISLYIPTSVQSLLYSYYTSVEQTTGDPASVIQSAFTATVAPSWLDAVPTAYQSNIRALESAVSSLRVAATGGVGATAAVSSSGASATGTGTTTGLQSSSGASGSTTAAGTSTGATRAQSTQSFIFNSVTSVQSSGLGMPTKLSIAAAEVAGLLGAMLAL